MSKSKQYYLLSILLLSTAVTACLADTFTVDNLPWIGNGPVLFKDDFSNDSGGWTTQEDPLSYSGYTQGEFRLWVQIPNFQIWSVPGLNFNDTHIYTRVKKQGGPDDNLFGLMCRYQDDSNFYALMISSDGYFGIFKVVDGEQVLIEQQHMDFNEAIHRGNSVNKMHVVCQDNQLALFVNDTHLLQVQDDSLSYGDVGVIAGNFTESGVDILFDDFIVLKP